MRQGVHLPQLSMAQNSNANRACRAMSTRIVEHHDPAMAEHARRACGERLVIHRRVEHALREIGAQRPADLHRADRPARSRAAAEVLRRFRARVMPKASSISPPRLTLPASWTGSVPRERPMPNRRRPAPPSARINGTAAKRQHIVDHASAGRTGPAARAPAAWRAPARACLPGFPAARFPRRRYRRRRRCAASRSKALSRAQDVGAEPAGRARQLDRRAKVCDGMRIFRADINITLVARRRQGAAMAMPSISMNGSPSSSMRSAKVPLSPSSALQTTYLRSAGASPTVLHLMPVGKPAPPRPRRPEVLTCSRSPPAPSKAPRSSPGRPPCARVILERQRIDHAAAGKGQPLLAHHPHDVADMADAQRMAPPTRTPAQTARPRRPA